MAIWTESKGTPLRSFTTPAFPGYTITLHDQTAHYVVHSPVGPIGWRPQFAGAEQLVVEDSELVASATQLNLKG
jgi:hypothetical protein